MKKSTRNILIGSGVAVVGIAAVGAVCHTVADWIVKMALNREEPKIMNKSLGDLMGAPENLDEIMKPVLEAAEKLRNSGLEQVEIISHDNIKLVGHWAPCENPKRVVIALHGWRSNWAKDFSLVSDFWYENGCSVLYVEQRGQSSSGGEYMGFGLLERYDCLDWINWVNERTGGKLPLYLSGISMGASTVMMAAGLELPENVCGISADSGYTSPYAIWKHVVENNLKIPFGICGAIASEMCRKKIQFAANEYSCTDAMRQCTIPMLFIHGTADNFVPIDMTYENYEACAAPKHLFIAEGADHGMGYLVERERCQEVIKEFWRDSEERYYKK